MSPILRIEGIVKTYRGVTALDGVSLEVAGGSITGLIGPNGSGKTTLFDCISGFQRRDAGQAWLSPGGRRRWSSRRSPRCASRGRACAELSSSSRCSRA
jgi:branched-chain amino acid transport system ATP-binding protein